MGLLEEKKSPQGHVLALIEAGWRNKMIFDLLGF